MEPNRESVFQSSFPVRAAEPLTVVDLDSKEAKGALLFKEAHFLQDKDIIAQKLDKFEPSKERLRNAFEAALQLTKSGIGQVLTFFSMIPGPISGKLLKMGMELRGRHVIGKNYEAREHRSKVLAGLTRDFGMLLKGVGDDILLQTSSISEFKKLGTLLWQKGKAVEKHGFAMPIISQIETLKNEFLTEGEKRERCLNCADRIANLILLEKRQGLDSPLKIDDIKQLQDELLKIAKNNNKLRKEIELRFKVAQSLTETINPKELYGTLNKIVDKLCKQYEISDSDARKEALMFGTDTQTAKLKMIKRLAVYLNGGINPKTHSPSLARRKEATGFEIAVIKGVEKAFKRSVASKESGSITEIDNDFTVIISDADIFVEEEIIGKGSYKIARLATDYFKANGPNERKAYISLKHKLVDADYHSPTKKDAEHLETASVTKSEEAESLDEYENDESFGTTKIHESEEDESFGTTKIHESEEGESFETMRIHESKEDESFGTTQIHESEGGESTETETEGVRISGAEKPKEKIKPSINKPINKMSIFEMKNELKILELRLNEPELHSDAEPTLLKKKEDLEKMLETRTKEHNAMMDYKTPAATIGYEKEIAAAQQLQGPGIVNIHSVVNLESGNKIMIQEAAGFRIQVEDPKTHEVKDETVIDCEQMQELFSKDMLKEDHLLKLLDILDDAFLGVERLHENGLIHRDIKPENILVTKEGKGALTDFGSVCKTINDPAKSSYEGTLPLSSPEVIALSQSDRWNDITEKSDIWSCGIVLQRLFFSGQPHPFFNKYASSNVHKIIFDVKKDMNELTFPQTYQNEYPEPDEKGTLAHLIWLATKLDPEERPSMKEFREKFNQVRSAIAQAMKAPSREQVSA